MSVSMQKKQQLIEWRRSKVLEYHSQGYSMTEITNMLHVKNVSTISRDLEYLREKAQENLKNSYPTETPRRIPTVSNWNESGIEVMLADC